jgi:hypothetical protein
MIKKHSSYSCSKDKSLFSNNIKQSYKENSRKYNKQFIDLLSLKTIFLLIDILFFVLIYYHEKSIFCYILLLKIYLLI